MDELKRLLALPEILLVQLFPPHAPRGRNRNEIDLSAQSGANIIDPFIIQEFDQFAPRLHPLSEVRAAIERYLTKTEYRDQRDGGSRAAASSWSPGCRVHLLSCGDIAYSLPSRS
jgi:hypothetical protein